MFMLKYVFFFTYLTITSLLKIKINLKVPKFNEKSNFVMVAFSLK